MIKFTTQINVFTDNLTVTLFGTYTYGADSINKIFVVKNKEKNVLTINTENITDLVVTEFDMDERGYNTKRHLFNHYIFSNGILKKGMFTYKDTVTELITLACKTFDKAK